MSTVTDQVSRRPCEPGSPRRWLVPAAILLLTLAVYIRVCGQGYVDWDDGLHVYANPYLGSWKGLEWLWRHPYGGLYVPLSYTAYAALAALAHHGGAFPTPEDGPTALDPRIFHSANLAMHLLNTLLVYRILHRLFRRDAAAGAGALLFAIHPVQVEAVAWISELRGLLCSFFSLLAIHACLRIVQDAPTPSVQWRRYMIPSLWFVSALLCKPNAVVVPLIVLTINGWLPGPGWRRSLPPMLIWMLVAALWLGVTRSAQPLHFLAGPLWDRPIVAGDALWFYGAHVLLPLRLGPDYGLTPTWALAQGAWKHALVIALALALLLTRRQAKLAAMVALFIIPLLPVLGLVPFAFQLYSTVADRYLSLALLGPAIAVSWLVIHCDRSPAARRLAVFVGMVALAGLAVRSEMQIGTWNNAMAFTANALAVNPRSWVMHYNRGKLWEARNDDVHAAAEYQDAIALNPSDAEAYSNLGNVLLRHRLFADADMALRTALAIDPALPQPHVTLALSLMEQGNNAAALPLWQSAVRLWPDVPLLRYEMAMSLLRLGHGRQAAAQFRTILLHEPRFSPAEVALASCRQRPGD